MTWFEAVLISGPALLAVVLCGVAVGRYGERFEELERGRDIVRVADLLRAVEALRERRCCVGEDGLTDAERERIVWREERENDCQG